jgi:hypothetical protein
LHNIQGDVIENDSSQGRMNMMNEDDRLNKKTRNRKTKENADYIAKANSKILDWEKKLESGNLSKSEKQQIQRKIAAQKFRSRQKEESETYQMENQLLRQKNQELVKILEQYLCTQCKETI